MAHFLVICLILSDVFVLLAAAKEKLAPHNVVEPNEVSFSKPPSPCPSLEKKVLTAEAPVIRKLGKHNHKVANKPFVEPSLSSSNAPRVEDLHSSKEVSASDEETRFVLKHQVEMKRTNKHQQHRSMEKSVVGGGLILGGLGATFLVAVFRYIRATGRKNAEPS